MSQYVIVDLKPYVAYKPSGVEWLGDVPAHWEILPNRAIFAEVIERNVPEEQMLSVTIKNGVILQEELLEDTSKKDGSRLERVAYKLVQPGDIAYNKMRAWQGAVGMSEYRGIISPAYVVQRPRNGTSPRYFHHLLRTLAFSKEAERWSYGITSDMWSLRPEHFRMIYTCVPPLPEQTAIVHYLDHVDERIRRYVSGKQKLIRLLEEKREVVIHRAVTGQVDVTTGQPYPAYKPSGVEWLGDVPAHWEVSTLGRIAMSFRTGPFGSMLHQSDYVEDGTPVINPIHMNNGTIVEDPSCSVPETVAERLSNFRLGLHDLAFSRRGELGRCAIVRSREVGWLCGTGCIRVRIEYKRIVPKFLIQALQVRWVGEYLSLSSVGATMDNLNTSILKGVPLLVPPIQQQKEIVEHIGQRTTTINYVIRKSEEEIRLIREYRTRLIADVVTGKLDVRGAAANLPSEHHKTERFDDTADVMGELATADGL